MQVVGWYLGDVGYYQSSINDLECAAPCMYSRTIEQQEQIVGSAKTLVTEINLCVEAVEKL